MAKKKKENIEVIEEPQVEAIEVIVEEPKKSRKEPSKKIINDSKYCSLLDLYFDQKIFCHP